MPTGISFTPFTALIYKRARKKIGLPISEVLFDF